MTLFKVTFYLSDGEKSEDLMHGDGFDDVNSVISRMLKENDFIQITIGGALLAIRTNTVIRYLVEIN